MVQVGTGVDTDRSKQTDWPRVACSSDTFRSGSSSLEYLVGGGLTDVYVVVLLPPSAAYPHDYSRRDLDVSPESPQKCRRLSHPFSDEILVTYDKLRPSFCWKTRQQ